MIPTEVIGKIIGKRGHQINHIEEHYRVKIMIQNQESWDKSTQKVTIEGIQNDDVEHATAYICDLITCKFHNNGYCHYGEACYFVHGECEIVTFHTPPVESDDQRGSRWSGNNFTQYRPTESNHPWNNQKTMLH